MKDLSLPLARRLVERGKERDVETGLDYFACLSLMGS